MKEIVIELIIWIYVSKGIEFGMLKCILEVIEEEILEYLIKDVVVLFGLSYVEEVGLW